MEDFMYSRMQKCVMSILVALISASFLVPSPVSAQEYMPAFGRVDVSQAQAAEQAQACLVVYPLATAPTAAQVEAFSQARHKVWVPRVGTSGPQCLAFPEQLNGIIGLMSPINTLVAPKSGQEQITFDAISGADLDHLGYTLNPAISYQVFEEAAKGQSSGYYKNLVGLWYLGQEEATNASTNLIPPFGGPEWSYAIRLAIASDLFGTEGLIIVLTPLTRLYKCPGFNCESATVGSICPNDQGNYYAIYFGSFSVPQFVSPVTVLRSWSSIAHTQDTLDRCQNMLLYNYMDAETTWVVLGEAAREDVELVAQSRERYWSENIILQPIGGTQQPVFGDASFQTFQNGEVAWIGIAVSVAGVILKFIAAARGAPVMP